MTPVINPTRKVAKRSPRKNPTYFETCIDNFHNALNKVTFTGFTKYELTIFFSIVALINDQGGKEVSINFDDL